MRQRAGWADPAQVFAVRAAVLDALATPLTLTLGLGEDSGTTSVTATTPGQERRADHGQ